MIMQNATNTIIALITVIVRFVFYSLSPVTALHFGRVALDKRARGPDASPVTVSSTNLAF